MDIKQLDYFITIVEENYNLTRAAKKLHLSQPALSKMILSFEERENISLFYRQNGRLNTLTPVGEYYYREAKDVVKKYDRMMKNIHQESERFSKVVRIGIPSFLLSEICSELMSSLILDDNSIDVELYESDTYDVRQTFIDKKLDIAFLLQPTDFTDNNIEETLLMEDYLDAFIADNHPLCEKEEISWQDLNDYPLAIPTQKFMLHTFILERLAMEQVHPHKIFNIDSGDFLYHSVKKKDIITLLPSVTAGRSDRVVRRPIRNPICWNVVLCRHIIDNPTETQELVCKKINQYFQPAKTKVKQ